MTRYTDTKSVKVDNWGVFFLQKLQNFFNKTDHCDLTLQFNDNSQLKVHRLVLSACTDYFNLLESTCEMYEDVLIMPMDLQADVIVPIVNFMYTGTLEFQYNMYERLLKTATDMNMTVLLKLLEAHKQTTRIPKQPVLLNKQAPRPAGRPPPTTYQSQSASRQVANARIAPPQKPRIPLIRHQTTISPGGSSYSTNKSMSVPDPLTASAKYGHGGDKAGPSRFDDTVLAEGYEGSFDSITYESKPLLTAEQVKKEEESSPFEKLRKGYTNVNVVKRPATSSLTTPPSKKPNLEEVKEFTEAARLRSQLTNDDEDSPDYADDDTHFNDDDDEDYQPPSSQRSSGGAKGTQSSYPKQIMIKSDQKGASSGGVKQITVKDDSGSVDHAKIISEVLKKYPHLVKKNKNIKLKIMQKTVPSQAAASSGQASQPGGSTASRLEGRPAASQGKTEPPVTRKAATYSSPDPAEKSTPIASSAPKKIDAKTMHALIAKGAENMTGPWLCLRCGIGGRPISIPSYKAFRNHLVVKHKERIDHRVCEHCGFRAEQRNPHLLYHWLTAHNIRSTVNFPTCDECGHVAMNADALNKHEEETHQRADLQQCIYCNKVFAKEMQLYDHMKTLHKERARDDGVLDFSDDEYMEEAEAEPEPPVRQKANSSGKGDSADNKIKVISDISLPSKSTLPFMLDPNQGQTVSQIGGKQQPARQITLEPSSEAEAMSNVASSIATSLGLVDNAVIIDDASYQTQFIESEMANVHGEGPSTVSGGITKLVTVDGTELQLTQSQKEDILSQLQMAENGSDNMVVVLNDASFTENTTLQLGDDVQIVNTASAELTEDPNIVLMYDTPNEGTGKKALRSSGAMSTEDETSQTSQQSDKTDGKRSETTVKSEIDESMEEDDEAPKSQGSKRADGVREKELTETEADTSADLSETTEVIQQIVQQQEDDDDDVSKMDTSTGSQLEEESEEKQKADKLKLISELEGDWSEDTEEHPVAAEEKKAAGKKEEPAKVEKPAAKDTQKAKVSNGEGSSANAKKPPTKATTAGEGSTKSSTDAATAGTADKVKLCDKEIDKLLDEWNNETKFEASDTEAELEKKLEKVTGDVAESVPLKMETPESVQEAEEDDKPVAKEGNPPTSQTAKATEDIEAIKVEDNEEEESTPIAVVTRTKLPRTPVTKSDDEDNDDNEDEEEKDGKSPAKSKEVVSSLLGDWDEDDDL